MMRGAIKGMLESLGDEHTSYIDPDLLRQESIQLSGEYEGIGAWADTTGEFLIITNPMPDSPAEKAGIKPGDIVIKVDGEDMTGKDGNYALSKVLGPTGTVVTLTIQRKDQASLMEFSITRAKIEVASVESKVLPGDIGFVHILTFGDKTGSELKQALRKLREQEIKGLIVDLRFNGGGLLTSAVDVGSQFLESGVLMYEEYGTGQAKEFRVKPGGLATDIPLVLLVNEGTASASEIVAGAIQDMERGKLVGVTTYGKGSVQNWIDLSEEEGAVRITVARWLTPNKRQINKVGLTPDVEITMTENDYLNEKDPQLDAAVKLLLEAIK
jgi:carboxyl-terminal processing protease